MFENCHTPSLGLLVSFLLTRKSEPSRELELAL